MATQESEPRKFSRREFLKVATIGGAGLLLGCTAKPAPAAGVASPTPRPSDSPPPPPSPTPKPELPPEPTATPTEAPKSTPEATPLPRVISKDNATFKVLPPKEVAKLQQENLAQGKIRLPLSEKLLNDGVNVIIENYEYQVGGLPQHGTRMKLSMLHNKPVAIPAFFEGVVSRVVTEEDLTGTRAGGVISMPIVLPDGRRYAISYAFPLGSEVQIKEKQAVRVGDTLLTVTYRPGSEAQTRFQERLSAGDGTILDIGLPYGSELLKSTSDILAFSTP